MNTLNIRNVPAGEITEIKTLNGLTIEMFRSFKFSGDRDGLNGFRPAKVFKEDGVVVWTFQNSGAKQFEFGELFELGDDYVIALRDKFSISSVIRVRDLTSTVMVRVAGKTVTIGGSSIEEILDFKIALANELGIDYWKTPEEEGILKKRAEIAREKAKTDREAQELSIKEARKNREAFRATILARKQVEAWSADGHHFYGIPVTGDEWMSLPTQTYCITMQDDKPVEAFIVDQKGGTKKKLRPTAVSAEKPKQKEKAQVETLEADDQISVTIRGETRPILVFNSMSSLKTLQSTGLNSGTWVGVLPKGSNRLTVYGITKDDIRTIGQLERQSTVQ